MSERAGPLNDLGVRWPSYLPAAALVIVMSTAWIARSPADGMNAWGVSAAALAEGRYETLLLNLVAHGGAVHLLMNSAALLEVGGIVVARLGGYPRGWWRFLLAFTLSGLSGAILFLCAHPEGRTPLVGASGGVYGLLGVLLFSLLSEELDPDPGRSLLDAVVAFVRNNAVLLVVILIGASLSGLSGRTSWEAHLGGFLFGLCIGPWICPRLAADPVQRDCNSR